MLMKLTGGKLCKEVACCGWMVGFANVLNQIEMKIIAMDICVNVFGLHHMTVHAIITKLTWNDVTSSCRALEHLHKTNADSRGHSAD